VVEYGGVDDLWRGWDAGEVESGFGDAEGRCWVLFVSRYCERVI
jgi:hypothetical protein